MCFGGVLKGMSCFSQLTADAQVTPKGLLLNERSQTECTLFSLLFWSSVYTSLI